MESANRNEQTPNRQIIDLASFKAVTGEPRQVAGLYFYLMLDCLVEVAIQISMDFFKRPHLYTNVGGTENSELLAKLLARTGSDERLPSKPQRSEIYVGVFNQSDAGTTDNTGNFPRLRDDLLTAAATFAERVFDTGVDMLRERVRTTHRPFKDYLVGLQGDSVRWSAEQALLNLTENTVYNILRNSGTASGSWGDTGPMKFDGVAPSV